MVKDVDGVERYESAAEMKFSDGSMEQDLPMQQLSEMFNTNHFLISEFELKEMECTCRRLVCDFLI